MPRSILPALALATLALPAAAQDTFHVIQAKKYAWAENVGYLNFADADNTTGATGVRILGNFLSGRIWSENIGWISVGDGNGPYLNTLGQNSGVNFNPVSRQLSGYAWSENAGWINFSGGALATPPNPARVESLGASGSRLRGYAWGENIGWINLDDASAYICALLTDLNADGIVNTADLTQLLVKFGQSVPAGSGPDFDSSGAVNTADLTQLLVQFGRTCP